MATVRSNKNKGLHLQKWVAEKLSKISGIPWGAEDEMEIQSRPMGQHGVDIILRGKAAKRFPFSFECKSGESFQLVKTIEQARDNQREDRPWIIVHRRKKFRNPIVMMDWDTFESLISDKEVDEK
jgi:hypothetical protein